MKRITAIGTAAALALAALGTRAASADVHLSDHQAFYALDFGGSQVQYDAYDVVTADASGDSLNSSVNLLGDPSTFVWDGAGTFPGTTLTVSNVTAAPGVGSATLTVTGSTSSLVGSSHYGYLSNVGQGLLSADGSALDFEVNPNDLMKPGQIDLVLAGKWTAGAGALGDGLGFKLNSSNEITGFTYGDNIVVTNDFTYDAALDATTFSAQVTPEPGVNALLAGMLLTGGGVIFRRGRRRSL